ncbi:hypothetical protein B0H66DRAFT_504945 [Apodospora peruviana]|uniref:Vps41 beta-propeller domain-containing protein n=1 Tax=Apodospora peruviana TaxID=516989 RepID=A0AAE0HUG1_9PEZI|nr:hypothetical protein B0H66DRAFT_504945 [Apodospora peruviana]
MTDVPPQDGDNCSHDESPDPTKPDATDPTEACRDPHGKAPAGDGADTEDDVNTATEADSDEEDEDEEDDDEEEEEEEDEEPKLKYARLTSHLGPVYRNGDATSAFLVAGDKMIIGTHNGNIHVIQLPSFQSLRVYHAHSASVTSISISPYPPPLPTIKAETAAARAIAQSSNSPLRPGTGTSEHHASPTATSRRPKEPPSVPNTPSNNIHIATSSMDGNICVQSLVDLKDVQLRNFSRPIQAVALSPDYKNDRTYLSGGLAGQLILTVGAPQGRSTATTTGAAAQAAGWLGSMVGQSNGKDTVLHSGEGTISTIKWSWSGKYVAWMNEHGIWIMRTKLHLDSADADDAWKPVGHVDRPLGEEWETMASVWKGRAEWIDEQAVELDESDKEQQGVVLSPAAERLKQQQLKNEKKIERLILGWGNTVWIVHVHPGGIGVGKHVGERSAGKAGVVNKLRMDCIISGISLYTQNLLLVLAYCLPDEDDEEEAKKDDIKTIRGHKHTSSTTSTGSEPSGGIPRRQNNLLPELRLIDLTSQTEVLQDGLSVSRFERLNAGDYHLGVLPARNVAAAASTRGALEALAGLGTDMLNAALNPKALFSSAASIRSKNSNDGVSGTKVAPSSTSTASTLRPGRSAMPPGLAKPGVKIFIHSPYDCILATERDLSDHLQWLLERHQYQQAWELVDEHPEITSTAEKLSDLASSIPDQTQTSDDFFDDSSSVQDGMRSFFSSAEKEKRRIGELWMHQLIKADEWTRAGQVYAKVLGSPDRWEEWAWTFVNAKRFDEIVNYLPTERTRPPLSGAIYELVLYHYLETNKPKFRDLLERWTADLFDVNPIVTALNNQLNYREVREDSVEDGEVGRDWRIVMESLAKLHEASGRNKEALRCYIKLQDADSTMRLIKDGHLAEAVADDIPSFIGLRVPQARVNNMTRAEIEEATSEAITLLVDEAQHGLVKPNVVVGQLEEKQLHIYTFFYLRGLWRGEGIHEHNGESRARLVLDSQSLVDGFADIAVHLFATFERPLLMEFLKTSTAYAFEQAVQECEHLNFIPELVYLYSKTGQMKRALYLIIDRLGDVSRAIAFAKEQNDPDLWEDLLNYSMDKPRFIRGLLEEVGTAINPITLVRRIPEGLEIEGLREGLKHIMKEHEIQYSISSGVARVLRSEVAAAQNLLRNGQRKGVKFEVAVHSADHVDVETKDVAVPLKEGADGETVKKVAKKWKPGHCAQCCEPFVEWEMETMVGFACGHVFHLTHLLECLHPGEVVDKDLVAGLAGEEGPRRYYLIGAKVTHARLLKDRIMAGCPVCVKTEDSDGFNTTV